jgi:predicted phosphodiesterase
MRLAVFSDVHGNLTALEAVLADISALEGIEAIVFAGDLCVAGPRPDACVERVRSHEPAIAAIYGNTDVWVSGRPLLAQDVDAEQQLRWQRIQNEVDWDAGIGVADEPCLAGRAAVRAAVLADRPAAG